MISSNGLRVSINSHGAELASLIGGDGSELLWQGGDPWPRRAPILFPIIGQMPGGILTSDGVEYPIGQHGFVRDLDFEVSVEAQDSVLLTVRDSAETRQHFPFAFELSVRYTLVDNRLSVTTTVVNSDSRKFFASLGAHPAFSWPLLEGVARNAHTIEFAEEEPAPVRRISGGLLDSRPQPSPVRGKTLFLSDSLFADDAVIFDSLVSRSVRYTAPGAPSILVEFDDFRQFGVWSKAPGSFVCLEPWFGTTAPDDFEGDYSAKPNQFMLEPGESRPFSFHLTVD